MNNDAEQIYVANGGTLNVKIHFQVPGTYLMVYGIAHCGANSFKNKIF